MHKITFFPLGSADSYLVECQQGRRVLFDYANMRNPDDETDRRVDLAEELRTILKEAERDYLDVVAFTHADDDHIHGASEFFHLEFADKYQTEGRIKIKELWVPAAMILEDGLDDEARILRQEARHRLIQGAGIRVFSRPEALTDWLQLQGIALDSRRSLISNAGGLVDGFSKERDGVEFFVHSPFSKHCDEGEIDRNVACLGLQATFDNGTQLLMTADATHEVWEDIVSITKAHHNEEQLKWDIFKVPHHCSYLSIGPDKGTTKTAPTEAVDWLLKQGKSRSFMVITSDAIPSGDEIQPPHRQAYNSYDDYRVEHDGELLVTMEHPSKEKPGRLVVTIDGIAGATVQRRIYSASIGITSRPAPRAG